MTRQQQLDACAVVEVDCTLRGGYIETTTMHMCAVTALANAAGYDLLADVGGLTLGKLFPKISERFGLSYKLCNEIMEINDSFNDLEIRRQKVREKILSIPVTG